MKRIYIFSVLFSSILLCSTAKAEPPKCGDKLSISSVKEAFIRQMTGGGGYIAVESGVAKSEDEFDKVLEQRMTMLQRHIEIGGITSDGYIGSQKKRLCSGELKLDAFPTKISANYYLQSLESERGFKSVASFDNRLSGRVAFNAAIQMKMYLLNTLYEKEIQERDRAASAAAASSSATAKDSSRDLPW